jgi:NitT/TauT family transport system ATP-binding protein
MQEEMGRILASNDPALRKTMVLVTHSIEESILLSDHIVVLTRRPGTVKAELRVDLPRPRQENDPAFMALKQQIRDLIHDEFEIET